MNTLDKYKKLEPTKEDFIPNGTYKIECTSISEEISNYTHADYIATRFKIVEGDYQGQTFSHNFNIEGSNNWARNNAIRLFNALLDLYPDINELTDIEDTVIEAVVEHYIPKNTNYLECNRLKKVIRLVDKKESDDDLIARIRAKKAKPSSDLTADEIMATLDRNKAA